MAGNTIDAKLRILTDAVQAIAQMRELRREVLETRKAAAAPAGGGGAGQSDTRAATEDAQQAAAVRQKARQEERAAIAAQRLTEEEARRARRASAQAEAAEEGQRRAAQRKATAERVREEQDAGRKVRAEANLQTNARRQLPAQVTDIVTSLQGGQAPLTVLIQQGGQLNDSFGGPVKVLKAFASLLTPTRVLVGGLAAGIGFLALMANRGYQEQDRLNKSLVLTGDASNASIGQIDSAARRIAAASKSSIGDVRETLQELVDAGAGSAGALDATARAATAYRKITGATAADAAKLFAGQRDAVLDWATKANKAYNFLTAAQLDHIRVLQSQGREDQALRFANEELAKSLEQRVAPAIGSLERGWNSVKAALSGVLDALKAIGRDDTPAERLAKLQDRLRELLKLRDEANKPKAGLDPSRSIVGQLLDRDKKGQDALSRPAVKDDQVEAARAALEAEQQQQDRAAIRAAERAIAQKAEQEAAFRESKSFTDALAAVDLAGQQKLAAQRLAGLDKQQSDLELNHARQVVSAQEFNQRMNELDQQRLQVQAQLVRAQIQIERQRKIETPLDGQAKAATVAQLEAQLVAVQSALSQAGGKAQQLLAADATNQAADWEKAWRDAAQRISQFAAENASTAASRITDPAQRARAAALAATADQQREFDDQRRKLRQQIDQNIDPGQARDKQGELDAFTREGTQALAESRRRVAFAFLRSQLEEFTQLFSQREQDLDALAERGAITTEQAEQRKLAARQGSAEQLALIVGLLRATSDAASQSEQNQVLSAEAAAKAWGDFRTTLEKTARSSAVNELAQGLTDIQTRSKTAGEALRDMVLGFAKTMLQVLNQRLAEKLVKSVLDAANASGQGSGGGGGWGAFIGAIVKGFAGVNHAGGVIGQASGHAARSVFPLAFAGAQVMHGGGLAGMVSYNDLAPNERRSILEVGEEVLPADSPRHIKNFRGGGVSVQTEITINGASGGEAEQRAAGGELDRRIRSGVDQWAAEQRRQGGILSGR